MSDREDRAEADELAGALERLSRLLRAREHDRGLNPAQWEALRYVSRANRFSNSPGALSRYLGATKGTISQTVMALVRKGLIVKSERSGERRSVALTLTAAGEALLADDPWIRLARAATGLGGKTRRRAARALRELLAGELAASGHASFGTCRDCRFFREKGRIGDVPGPHLCMAFEEGLSGSDTERLCVAHAAG
jgi:DNA-binding MarR family transcriptional regulator